jgi:hypothetical protein
MRPGDLGGAGGRAPAADATLGEATALVLQHCDRQAQGPETDATVVAAVVGVERVAGILGTTDADTLRLAVLEALEHDGDDAPGEVARVVLELVRTIGLALPRRSSAWPADATVLNPETGGHKIATDLSMLRAAIRAARTSYEGLPYYRDRYGDRGARFSVSDSSWIVHLVAAPEAVAVQQVFWLADMLATRGMPTWLMELHLDTMAEELMSSDLPTGALPHAVAALALERAETLVAERVDAPPTTPVGRLLAAAAADVRSGASRSSAPLVDWVADPVRTSAEDAAVLRGLHDHLSRHGTTR